MTTLHRRSRVRDLYLMPVVAVLLLAGSSLILLYTYNGLADLSDEAIVADTQEFARSVAEFRNFYTQEIVPRGRAVGMPITHDWRDNTEALPLPATFAKDFGSYLGEQKTGTKVRLYSDFPFPWRASESRMDDFESEALDKLRRKPKEPVWRFDNVDGERVLRYAQADTLKASCVGCHNSYPGTPKTDWKVGELRGVLEVVRPVASIEAGTRSSLWNSFLLMVAITLSALLLIGRVIGRLRGSLDETEALAMETARINQELEHEVEERSAAENQARLSDAKNRAVVDGVVDGIVVIDERGIIAQFNKAASEVFGYEADEVVGQNVSMLMDEPHRSAHDGYLQHYLRTGEQHIIGANREVIGRRKNGDLFPLSLAVSEIRVGEHRLFSGIVRDITERKRYEEDLAQARDAAIESARLKSDFLATMSHEIRTPMNGIIGTAGLVLDTDLDDEQTELINTLRHSSESLLSIVNDILDFSKIEAGRMEFEYLEFDLYQAVEGMLDLLAERASSKGLELASFIDRRVPYALFGDSGRLRQVLTNLVGNSIKFTETGHVLVRVTEQQRDGNTSVLRFDIRDSGIGIAEDAQKRLFQSFSQVDSSMSRRFGGTGLGLAISRQLVEHMGGEIGVDSTPGEGSGFWFTVRLDIAETNRRGLEPLPERDQRYRVLVLETNPDVAEIVCEQLVQLRVDVERVESVPAAKERLTSTLDGKSFDVLILNEAFTGHTGQVVKEFAQFVHSTLAENAPKLLVLTDINRRIRLRDQTELHVEAFLHKPLKHKLLRDMLLQLLEGEQNDALLSDEGNEVHVHQATAADELDPDHCEPCNLRLLLVEDNKVNQMVALGHLKKIGFRIIDCVGDGKEALDALEIAPYDLVLMDWQMPEMDGFEATRQIRKREQGKGERIPIIAMTASAMKGDREACEAAGMDDYISKPLDRERLREVMRKWVEKVLNERS